MFRFHVVRWKETTLLLKMEYLISSVPNAQDMTAKATSFSGSFPSIALKDRVFAWCKDSPPQHDHRPFPNYLWPLFQSESWCSSFHHENLFLFACE